MNNKRLIFKKNLLKLLLIILFSSALNITSVYAESLTRAEWFKKITTSQQHITTNPESIYGYVVKEGYIRHPDFFGEKACQCGQSGKVSAKYKSGTKANGLSLGTAFPSSKRPKNIEAQGVFINNIYYPTCEEFTYFICKVEPDDNPLSTGCTISEPSSSNLEKLSPRTLSSGEKDKDKVSSIDVSDKYKPNTATSEEVLNAGGNDGDADEYNPLAVKKTINFSNKDSNAAIHNLFNWVKSICNIILGFSIVIGLGTIVYLFISLGINSANPHMREKIKSNLIIVCTATAVATIMGTVFNLVITKVIGL